MTNRPIWQATADGVYACTVTRTDEQTGLLTVVYSASDVPVEIHRQNVNLTDGTPYTWEIDAWRQLCSDAIDHPAVRQGVPC